jgi:hypothetical protein
MNLREIGCEDGMWMELSQDHVQWWALLMVLNLPVFSSARERQFCVGITEVYACVCS